MRRTALHLVVFVTSVVALAACRPSDGPVPIAYDEAACAHCRMLISEPAFSAQIQTDDGEVLDFDDPGCLLRYRAERKPAEESSWFHHVRENRFVRGNAVGFVRVPHTPMGFGFGAVDADEPGAIPIGEVSAEIERSAARRGAP